MKTYIYLIENCYNHPNKIYIGKTVSPSRRLTEHKITYGKGVEFTIIDEVDSTKTSKWKPLECYWIEQFNIWGFDLQNKNNGGGGVECRSELTKLKIGKSHKGLKKPGVSNKLKGHISYHKPDTGGKISLSKQGMIMDREWKKKISKSMLGNKNRLNVITTQETKDKISKALKGRKRPLEVIEKMKKPRSTSINMGKHRLGKTHNPVSINKMKSSKNRLKPVIQYDLDLNLIKEYIGVNEASRQTNIPSSAITMCCKGKLKTTNKTIFKYKNHA